MDFSSNLLSSAELLSRVHTMCSELGESKVWGQLRSMGIQVTREKVRNAVREIDPLNSAEMERWFY